ncbi:MAG: AmmeMemoRadiSam system radical SAM enzyme [Candidatus Altiarchaeota archaeon]
MRQAMLYEKKDGNANCFLCAHRCRIPEGKRGVCRVRENVGGTLYSLVYGRAIAANPDPIEKKPLFHYKPGTDSYSIATIGCNFRCSFCQNWDISQRSKSGGEIIGVEKTPEGVVDEAIESGCESVSYTYTEPTIFFEYAYDTAKIAKEKGLGNVFVTNGYMTAETISECEGWLDAANVDLKSFSDEFYRRVCGGSLDPVLQSLKGMVNADIWVEVTTLVVPGRNDSDDELRQIANFIGKELGEHVPWHISRFHPDYKETKLNPTPIETIHRAKEIGIDEGLEYIYTGNVPHEDAENTRCPNCNELLIERFGFNVTSNSIRDSRCPACSTKIEGVDLNGN